VTDLQDARQHVVNALYAVQVKYAAKEDGLQRWRADYARDIFRRAQEGDLEALIYVLCGHPLFGDMFPIL